MKQTITIVVLSLLVVLLGGALVSQNAATAPPPAPLPSDHAMRCPICGSLNTTSYAVRDAQGKPVEGTRGYKCSGNHPQQWWIVMMLDHEPEITVGGKP